MKQETKEVESLKKKNDHPTNMEIKKIKIAVIKQLLADGAATIFEAKWLKYVY